MNKKQTPFSPVDSGKKLPQVEEDILKFWRENKIFEKSVENRKTESGDNVYSFYDGPPFATGLPHYGHIVASVIKDVIPRYWTMKGKYIPRKWGWDCHGLPIENIVEKELGSKTKKEIEELGVEKFNNLCRSKVLSYAEEWKKIITRLGRWADMDNPYKTMDKDFMESVWWTFKQLWDKDLIYYDYRSMHICPRCETTLSQSEVSEGYKDVKDLSVVAKFEVTTNLQINNESTNDADEESNGDVVPLGGVEQSEATGDLPADETRVQSQYCDSTDNIKTYILAWTTTPWTLPGNVALAVGKDIDYVVVEGKDENGDGKANFILAENKLEEVFGETRNKKVFLISGKHAFASRKYFPELKKDLEKIGYEVTIIDHINSSNPDLKENLKALEKYDFNNAHVITHSSGCIDILQHLTNTKQTLSSLTSIAPPTQKIVRSKETGYSNLAIDYKKIANQIIHQPTIIYSDEQIISEEDFVELGKKLNAKLIKENNKGHYFEEKINNFPDFDVAKNLSNYANYKITKTIKGSDLVGLKYKPLWDLYAGDEKLENRENGWQVVEADFVTTDEGTGVVHIAPAFGEDDMNLGKEKKLPFVQHVAMNGVVDEKVEAIGGLNVKPLENPQATDVEVIKYLANKGLLFHKEKYEHSYPHCWRCDTPLINYATGSWFVAVTKIKKELLENAKDINWTPEHIKEGRWGKWLEGGRDWSISRQRFWASVMPIWICNKCENKKIFGSVSELKEASGVEVDDLHKHIVDKITFKCEKCDGEMRRVPDVLDTWFDSGSMPYGQAHYPFDNKEKFEKGFPADFIAEGIDQTRAWFYYLHIIAGGIFNKKAFKNVIVNGIVLAEDGQKMSKKLQNYPDPMEMVNKYGADPLKFYLAQSPVVNAQDLNFSEKDLAEIARGTFRMLWQSYSFFVMYANIDRWSPEQQKIKIGDQENILDKWIVSELHQLIKEVDEEMENYHLMQATRKFAPFVDNLSNWYIRRSRKRFWKSENDSDKNGAYATLHYVLVELSKTIAPFAPYLAEEIYKNLTGEESVHLQDYPLADKNLIDEKLNKQMQFVRDIISEGLKLRARTQIKVRQPLSSLKIKSGKAEIDEEFMGIIKEELNVKNVEVEDFEFDENAKNMSEINGVKIMLDTEITEDLKLEGQAREIIRAIQQMRKEADYQLDDRIEVGYSGLENVFAKFKTLIAKETLADKLINGKLQKCDIAKKITIDKIEIKLELCR